MIIGKRLAFEPVAFATSQVRVLSCLVLRITTIITRNV